ncbi:MAG: peptide deformylase, partial [Geothrix sp.]|nr:peptide deformylase [Geothrix sp.]
MAVLPVLTWGDPRLKKNSEDVGAWTPELEQLVSDMFETALDEEGVGLAAPQVGVNLNLAVIDCSCGEDPAERIILINPEIIREEGVQVGTEGCLSIPGIREVLERPQKVGIRNRFKD